MHYAGFWRRFAANVIDSFWLGLISYIPIKHSVYPIIKALADILNAIVYKHSLQGVDTNYTGEAIQFPYVLLLFGILFKLYYASCESSKFQATLGKLAVGIKVTDENGNRLTFLHSLGRNMAKLFSSAFLCFGYIMAGWDSKKQALHDKVAATLVVRK